MYGKIFEQIYDGSLRLNWKALITFQQMIVLCDSDGVVDMTHEALHFRTGIPLEIINEGIQELESPDERSRSPEHNGRRIIRLDEHRDWGWFLVNHQYYRDLISREEKKEKDRIRIKEKRAAIKSNEIKDVAKCSGLSQSVHDVAHTNTDTNTDIKELVVGAFTLSDNSEYEIEQSFIKNIKNAYPDVNIIKEIKLMSSWCFANPKKRKTRQGAKRFINNWLASAQKVAEVDRKKNNDPQYEYAN